MNDAEANTIQTIAFWFAVSVIAALLIQCTRSVNTNDDFIRCVHQTGQAEACSEVFQ